MIATAVQIAPVDSSHCDLLSALHAECFDKAWDRESFAALLGMPGSLGMLAALPAQETAVETALESAAELVAEPAGYVLALDTRGDWEILSLGVRPAFRRRGIGRALMDRVLSTMPQKDSSLVLEVAEDNIAAQRLYTKIGFERIGQRPRYYGRGSANPVDALVLKRTR